MQHAPFTVPKGQMDLGFSMIFCLLIAPGALSNPVFQCTTWSSVQRVTICLFVHPFSGKRSVYFSLPRMLFALPGPGRVQKSRPLRVAMQEDKDLGFHQRKQYIASANYWHHLGSVCMLRFHEIPPCQPIFDFQILGDGGKSCQCCVLQPL